MEKLQKKKIWLVIRVIGIVMGLISMYYITPFERKILWSYMIMTIIYEEFSDKRAYVFSICLCIDAVLFYDAMWIKILCTSILHIDLFIFFFGHLFQSHNNSI